MVATKKPVTATACKIYSLASHRYSEALTARNLSYHWGRAVYNAANDILKTDAFKYDKFRKKIVNSNVDCRNIPERVEDFVKAIDEL